MKTKEEIQIKINKNRDLINKILSSGVDIRVMYEHIKQLDINNQKLMEKLKL